MNRSLGRFHADRQVLWSWRVLGCVVRCCRSPRFVEKEVRVTVDVEKRHFEDVDGKRGGGYDWKTSHINRYSVVRAYSNAPVGDRCRMSHVAEWTRPLAWFIQMLDQDSISNPTAFTALATAGGYQSLWIRTRFSHQPNAAIKQTSDGVQKLAWRALRMRSNSVKLSTAHVNVAYEEVTWTTSA